MLQCIIADYEYHTTLHMESPKLLTNRYVRDAPLLISGSWWLARSLTQAGRFFAYPLQVTFLVGNLYQKRASNPNRIAP